MAHLAWQAPLLAMPDWNRNVHPNTSPRRVAEIEILVIAVQERQPLARVLETEAVNRPLVLQPEAIILHAE